MSVELTVDRIAAGGDGIARMNDIVVFVPRSAPGDRLRASVEQRKRFARGRIEEILVPSPERIEPSCEHYRVDDCGGCQLQHLNYDSQIIAKQGIVRDALTRIGKRQIDAPPTVVPSATQWRYRRKLTLAMRRNVDGSWTIGLRRYDDPSSLFQLQDCPITDERVIEVWKQVMQASTFFPPADELRAAVIVHDEGASVVMEGGNAWPERAKFFDAVSSARSLWWRPAHRARSLVAERRADANVAAADASFVQVNAEMGDKLHAYVIERARAHRPATLVDAYSGSGATAIPLALDGIRVTAIEADRDATAYCAARLPAGSRATAARVEEVLDRALPADVVLINPPRTGIHESVAATLQTTAEPPRALVYVSCDPATLGRDLARMPRYRIASLRAFDMFPQTAHVETVCELVPEDAA